ncbi:MAG TPA: squalene/phytoene synthase family protein [Solirubrobacteraceae bacterium]|nr:squalene/phytoene synthase family protein [Solirubrobacteraceae bacterium]
MSGSTQMPSVTPNALVATAVISNGAAPTVASMWARAAETLPLTGRLRLGRRRREQVRAIYGFARLVQNLGAEAGGDGRMLLDWIDVQLSVIFAGDVPDHPLLRAFGHTIRESRLPAEPLHRLVEVNRRHDGITRFETFGDLIDDCRRTAGPVGELVLHVFGAATPARLCRSDAIWAGLGVTERLQNVGEDYARGRIYLPHEDMRLVGCRESDLSGRSTGPALRALLALEVERAHALLDEGAPLLNDLPVCGRLAVARCVAFGRAALDGLRRRDYDVLGQSTPTDRRAIICALVATLWRR